MKELIKEKLASIAAERRITILYACESGSRAWGFPSPDSDWDVRFVYLRPRDYYLSVAEREDQLSFPINDELDLYGWDLRKVLRLMLKSNVTPFEWLQSPIVYDEAAGFREAMWAVCPHYFSARANVHHYLGIARGAMKSLRENGSIKIKKLFYVLRPLLAAKWCLEKDSIAPMEIGPLMEGLAGDLHGVISDLIRLKEGAAEGFVIPVDARLRTYIEEEMARIGAASDALPAVHFTPEKADAFFRQTIDKYEHTGA